MVLTTSFSVHLTCDDVIRHFTTRLSTETMAAPDQVRVPLSPPRLLHPPALLTRIFHPGASSGAQTLFWSGRSGATRGR